MLILLPPSEGKTEPTRGRPFDIDALSHPEINEHRHRVLTELERVSRDDPEQASRLLRLGPTQGAELARNAALSTARSAPAKRVFTGVLYDALGLADLPPGGARRASTSVLIFSALLGLVRPNDPIPAYRLAGDVALPGVGRVAASWRTPLAHVVEADARSGLVLDMRSGPYLPMWRPSTAVRDRTITVRVVRDVDGRRTAVSHANKATKGAVTRCLLLGASPTRSRDALLERLRSCGWRVDLTDGVLDVLASGDGPSTELCRHHSPTAQ